MLRKGFSLVQGLSPRLSSRGNSPIAMSTKHKLFSGSPGSVWGLLLLGWGLSCLSLPAQRADPLPEAYEAIQRGLTLNAQRILQRAREHPDSLVRWEAALLQGILADKGGREAEALRHWYFVSQQSPTSSLAAEATYLRADLLLRRRPDWPAALYLLRTLLEAPYTPPALRREAEARLEHFAFREADLGFLWNYIEEGSPTLYPYLAPAVLYHLRQACYWPLWRLWEKRQVSECGVSLPDSLSWQALTDSLPVDTLRVVLLLPLMATQERSSPFLEFWQGFEIGLRESRSPYRVWVVEVEDSERSPLRLQELFAQWEIVPPHVIVGEVSWSLNQRIADFCERKGIWHAVPINPAYPARFLSLPLSFPAECHGRLVGTFLRQQEGGISPFRFASPPTVCLYDPQDPQSTAFVNGLSRTYPLPLYAIPTGIPELTRRWTTLKDSLAFVSTCVLAIYQEEALGFLLHKLGRDTLWPTVIGVESWSTLRHTNLRDYWRLRIWVPQGALPDSLLWQEFSRKVWKAFSQRPTVFHAQGYDAARWIATLSSAYSRNGLPASGEMEGLLGRYMWPLDCERLRWRLWEYERGEVRIRYDQP